MQNKDSGVTKEIYFTMCAEMNSSIIESEIPIDIWDLSEQSQTVLDIFNYLEDKYNSTTGIYEGKSYNNLFTIYKLFNIEENNWLLYTGLLNIVNNETIRSINEKIKHSRGKND